MPNDTEDRIRKGQFEDIYRSRVASGARNSQHMDPDEIVQEITSLRETMNLAAQRIIDLSRALYARARRSSDSTTSAYLSYANGWTRLAGALQQGLRRTSTTDRILFRAQQIQQEASAPQPQAPAARKVQPTAERPNPLHNANPLRSDDRSTEDLVKLYGKEIVRGARG